MITPNEAGLYPFLATQFNIVSNHGRYPIIHVETGGEIG
jgi:hypothetical protein